MKRFFSKSYRPSATTYPPQTAPTTSTSNIHPANPGLQPKFTVPPVPHPCPHEYIAVLVTQAGLLLRPHVVGLRHPSKVVVRVGWGREGKVEEIQSGQDSDRVEENEDWGSSVIIYGIVGVLQLTFGVFLSIAYQHETDSIIQPHICW